MNEKVTPSAMEDPEDIELQSLMGNRFQDLTQEPASAPNGEKKPEPAQVPVEKKACQKAMDAAWAPVKVERTEIQRMMNCAKQTALYGGISALLFWWQQSGLLASEAAWPSFIVLALLAGLKIGSCMAAKG